MRERIYAGELIRMPARPEFADFVRDQVEAIFGSDYRQPRDDFMDRLGEVRKGLKRPETQAQTLAFLRSLGLAPEEYGIDHLRLRGVAPGAHEIPAAAPAFYAHRDTWYANPQCQVNIWMPLHEVGPEDSFAFYEDCFRRGVANDSELFDYGDFTQLAGFQNPHRSQQAVYPRLLEDLPRPPGIIMKTAEVLLFSAAHLHQTVPNRTQRVRFSVDLRIVHRGDLEAGRAAPNHDNRSRGSALPDYPW